MATMCFVAIRLYTYRLEYKTTPAFNLRPSINGLVTDGNTKLCCHGFIFALFQNTTANIE